MSLKKAFQIMCREFDFTHDCPRFEGNCLQIRREWDGLCLALLSTMREGAKQKRFEMTVKGCKRIFDVACPPCDRGSIAEAKRKWAARVAEDCTYGNSVSLMYSRRLKRVIGELVDGWGAELEGARSGDLDPVMSRDVYVPDRQGCLETTRVRGGTLATSSADCSKDDSLVRVGCAKQKGKYRVVTMQGARVKRVLRPVHTALYNHLSRSGWLVRGDVKKDDFDVIADAAAEAGERVISGDYVSATDLIHLSAVEAVVEVISKDHRLTVEEREVLVGSFRELRWVDKRGELRPIKRGSMMGNLVSFPILCLLNKACHDIAAEEVYGKERRLGRFNGDDCCFPGSPEMYAKWRLVTSIFGFEVNESKTLFSARWIDLNSQVYDQRKRNLIAKPVLSFLRPSPLPGEILSSVLSGIVSFKLPVQKWIVHVLMRHEICLKGDYCLHNIPLFWSRDLVRRAWFRRSVFDGPASVLTNDKRNQIFFRRGGGEWYGSTDVPGHPSRSGDLVLRVEERLDPQVKGPPPRPEFLGVAHELQARAAKSFVDKWEGVKCVPLEKWVDRKAYNLRMRSGNTTLPTTFWIGFRTQWSFLWSRDVYESFPPHMLLDHSAVRRSVYGGSSPYLTLEYISLVRRDTLLYPPPLSQRLSGPRRLGHFPFLEVPSRGLRF